MPRIEHIIIGFIVVWAIVAIARHANRTEADKLRPSLAVRAVNAVGGHVEATRLLPATGELIRRGSRAVKARWSRGEPARTEMREAQRERAAEIAAKAREAAVRRGRAVVEATQRRWGQRTEDRPLIDRRAPSPPDRTTPEVPQSAPGQPRWRRLRRFVWWRRNSPSSEPGAPEPIDDGDSLIAGQADCPRCGAVVKGVIPASEQDSSAKCACGFRVRFFRAPNDPPDETGPGQTVTDQPRFHIVPKEDTDMTATTTNAWRTATPQPEAATVAQLAPSDWGQTAGRVADFTPDADYELINFMTGEVAGIAVYAAAFEQLHAACVESIGLDPVAVQGLGEFAEHAMELAKAMSANHQQFLVHYQEILQAVANGVLLPYNGRWMTGEAAI